MWTRFNVWGVLAFPCECIAVRLGNHVCVSVFQLYSVRPGRTRPHGLILLVLSLVYVLLALNVLLLSIAPQYTMYGDQRYGHNEVQPNNSIKREVGRRRPAGEGKCGKRQESYRSRGGQWLKGNSFGRYAPPPEAASQTKFLERPVSRNEK